MPVHVADDPLTCVARGTGIVLRGARHDGSRARRGHLRPRPALACSGGTHPRRPAAGRRSGRSDPVPPRERRGSLTTDDHDVRDPGRPPPGRRVHLPARGQPDPDGDVIEPARDRVPERRRVRPAPGPGGDPRRRRIGRRRVHGGRRDRSAPHGQRRPAARERAAGGREHPGRRRCSTRTSSSPASCSCGTPSSSGRPPRR